MFITLAQHKPIEVSRWIDRQALMTTTTESPVMDNSDFPQNIFSISYMYYSLFGTLITVLIGAIVSLLTLSEADAYDSKYIHPGVYRIAKWFPGAEKLFKENPATDIKKSIVKEPVEQHFNSAFDTKSEDIKPTVKNVKEEEANASNLKSNIIYKSEMEIHRIENYKKLAEDENPR